jgi:hypothetical protein
MMFDPRRLSYGASCRSLEGSLKRAVLKKVFFVVLVFAAVGLTACDLSRASATSTATAPPVGPGTPAPEQGLAQAVRGLMSARGFTMAVDASLEGPTAGKPTTWPFKGVVTYIDGSNYRTYLEGPADSFFEVLFQDGKRRCASARGVLPDTECSAAWGGPIPGSAPITMLDYLAQAGDVRPKQVAAQNADGLDYYTFVPNLAGVSAQSNVMAESMASVQVLKAEAWVDPKANVVKREHIELKSKTRDGSEQTWRATVEFGSFGQPGSLTPPKNEPPPANKK